MELVEMQAVDITKMREAEMDSYDHEED